MKNVFRIFRVFNKKYMIDLRDEQKIGEDFFYTHSYNNCVNLLK